MNGNWKTAWSMAHSDCSLIAPKTAGKTVRTTVIAHVSGTRIRIRLSNNMGSKAVDIGSAYVGIGGQKAIRLLFSGKQEITTAPNQYIFSDPIEVPIKAGDNITVSMYYLNSTKSVSGNLTAIGEHSIKGDYAGKEEFVVEKHKSFVSRLSPTQVTEPMTIFAGVDVFTDENVSVIAAFGDSLTGMGLWTNPLSARLYKEYPDRIALLNIGINGNRLLRDTGVKIFKQMYGLAAIKRMEWDIFSISGLTAVIIELGLNDIFLPGSAGIFSPKVNEVCTYEELIMGYKKIITRCRNKGIKVIGCTLTPCGGVKSFNEEKEALRKKINYWILNSGEYDITLDFASWIADANDASYIKKEYDCGDHVHPNAKGGEHIASQIDLSSLI